MSLVSTFFFHVSTFDHTLRACACALSLRTGGAVAPHRDRSSESSSSKVSGGGSGSGSEAVAAASVVQTLELWTPTQRLFKRLALPAACVEARRLCAFNFPAVVLCIGPQHYADHVHDVMLLLVKDESPLVRKTIALGLHEVATLLAMDPAQPRHLLVRCLFVACIGYIFSHPSQW
jgi:hypothetical protein